MADEEQLAAALEAYRRHVVIAPILIAGPTEVALAAALEAAECAAWRRPWEQAPNKGEEVEIYAYRGVRWIGYLSVTDDSKLAWFDPSGEVIARDTLQGGFAQYWRPLPPGPETGEGEDG